MNRWQRRARMTIALFGVVFAVFVVRGLRHRDPPPVDRPALRSDPRAVVETRNGQTTQLTGNREDASITFEHQAIYEDGTSKLQGVTIVFDVRNGDRTFTITA